MELLSRIDRKAVSSQSDIARRLANCSREKVHSHYWLVGGIAALKIQARVPSP